MPESTPEAFHRWFGASKVRDSKGQPRVVFHGTNAILTSFKTQGQSDLEKARLGAYFTANERVARHYGSIVMPVHLSIQNPLDMSNMKPIDAIELLPVAQMLKRELRSGFRMSSVNEQYGMLESLAGRGIRQSLIDAGHDGICYTEAHSDAYIAFRPGQIKSALSNMGTFDPENPDIHDARADRAIQALDWLKSQKTSMMPRI